MRLCTTVYISFRVVKSTSNIVNRIKHDVYDKERVNGTLSSWLSQELIA